MERTLEQTLNEMELWLGELVEVREQLRAIEGVLGVNQARRVLEERREAVEHQLRMVDIYLERWAPFESRKIGPGRVCSA